VKLQSYPLNWEKIGEVLKIRVDFLNEGTWTGMDGETVYYPTTVIHEGATTIPGKPIKRGHFDLDEAVVGFWTAYALTEQGVKAEGIIFDKEEINKIIRGEKTGISPEIDVDAIVKDGKKVATNVQFRAGALVENPACSTCRVESVAPIQLQKVTLGQGGSTQSGPTMEILLVPDTDGYRLIAPKPREVENMSENSKMETDFFDSLAKKLTDEGIPEDQVKKILNVLKTLIKPQQEKMNEPVQTPAVTPTVIETELRKPTKAAFLRWIRNRLKEKGLDRKTIAAVISVLEEAIKSPYPYPYPAPSKKKMSADLEEFWTEEVEKLENTIEAKEKEIDTLQLKLKKLEDELATLKKLEEDRKLTKKQELISSIKEIDESFNVETFLEGVECVDLQLKMLEHQLDTVKRLSPAIKLSAVAVSTDEQKVSEIIRSMFGTDNIDEVVKRDLPPEVAK